MKSTKNGAAMNMFDKEAPTPVILDIFMPGISCLKVLRYKRCELKMLKIPVGAVSDKRLLTDIQTDLKAGASVYLTKVLNYFDLKPAMGKVLDT